MRIDLNADPQPERLPFAHPVDSAWNIREAAIAYARNGFEIMPRAAAGARLIDSLKGSPRTGLLGEAEVVAFWTERPYTPALAVVCGPQSGVLVIDLDRGHGDGSVDGVAFWQALEARHGSVCTPLSSTPSGGRHLYFQWPTGRRLRSGEIAPGVEVLGDRCAATLPPSVKQGRPYLWSLSRHPNYLPMGDPPPWLLAMARLPEPKPRPRTCSRLGIRDRYARAALERECAAVANAPPGDRNRTLNLAAWSLARLEALTPREIEDGLLEAAAAAGMPAGEALRTVQSGLSRRRAA
jgi:hypothetical protein